MLDQKQQSNTFEERVETIKQGGAPKYHDQNKAKGKLFVRDRLALLFDNGEYVECTTIKEWIMDERIMAHLSNQYRLPLLREVRIYDYHKLDTVIRSHYPMLQITYFDNGLLGLANACIEILGEIEGEM